MAIPVENTGNYGGILVTQKYTPLNVNGIDLNAAGIQAQVTTLFQNRIACLNAQGILPQGLTFHAANWDLIQQNESHAATLPPLVVISSNRSQWIRDTWDTADQIQVANYADVNDIAALVAGSTPWYSPKRINDAHRHVYIMVHQLEYAKYQAALADTNMTVIGWEFDRNAYIAPGGMLPQNRTYVGFGASRYAAIEFCKHVFNHRFNALDPLTANIPLAAPRQKAWLVDDNVCYVNAFPGLANAEAELGANVWALGFTGATRNSSQAEVMALANNAAAPLGAALTDNNYLIQQCSVWNIEQLNANFLNFSPYFITSAEDSSLSTYLINDGRSKARFALGATVRKGMPYHDNDITATRLGRLRDTDVSNYYDYEHSTAIDTVIAGQNLAVGERTLINYINTYVLPLSQVPDQWSIYTESKAVEQILAKVVKDRRVWVPAQIFRPNGMAAQVVQRL
jgi:hypothetical protein